MNAETATAHNATAAPTIVSTVGNSGHFHRNQAIHAPASEVLEVAELGIHWAQPGMSGHSRGTGSTPVTKLPALKQPAVGLKEPLRARMWKFSIPLRHPETGRSLVDLDRLRRGLDRKSIDRYMWLIQDRDQGSAEHVQGTVKLRNARAREQLSSYFGLPASALKPLIDTSGQHGAFERYCRYLLHEGPEARADGKFQYSDADAHANFDFREMIDSYFGYASAAPVVSADQIKLMVYRGEMTPAEVEATYPMVFIRHLNPIKSLHERGEQSRRDQAEALEHAAQAEEANRRLELEAARRQHLTTQGFDHDEIELAIKDGLSEDALEVLRAEADAHTVEIRKAKELETGERKKHEEREAARRESPEHQEHVQRESAEEERRLIVAEVAMFFDIRGNAGARDEAVLAHACKEGLTSRDYLPGEVLSIDDARTLYIDTSELVCRSPEDRLAKVREGTASFRRDLERAPFRVAMAEMHAADGNTEAFEKAYQLRTEFGRFPDLVALPTLRTDLSKKQHAQLLKVA